MDCFPQETLAAYQEGALPASEQEALERHAARCGSCRGVLLLIGLQDIQAPARRPGLWAAAAAVLLCAGLGWVLLRQESRDIPQERRLPETVSQLPSGTLQAPGAYLARGTDLVLEAGSRVVSEGGRLRLEGGRIWLEASAPAVLELPGASVTLRGAIAARARPSPQVSWFLGDACAGEEILAELWVLRGEAAVAVQGRKLLLQAGRKLALVPGGFREIATAESEIPALAESRLAALASAPGQEPAGSPPAWRWVTVLSGRDASAELGFTMRIAGAWWQWVAGLAAVPPKPREVVELAWDGEKLTARVDGAARFSADRAHLQEFLKPAGSGWGVSAWGAPVTIVQSRMIGGQP